MEKINRVACGTVRVIGIVFVGYLFLQGLFTVCCIRRVTEVTCYVKNDAFRQLAGIFLFGGLVWLLQRETMQTRIQKKGRLLTGISAVVVLAAFAVWISVTDFWYSSDMEKIYQYAGMLLGGDFSGWQPGGYPYEWTQQNGLILFVAVLLGMFGLDASCLIFYFVNLFFYGLLLGSTAVILRRLSGKREICVIQEMMLLLYFPYGFLTTMLYGDVIGFAFGCMALALLICYLEDRRVWQIAGSCICMIMAVIFKQNELILFIGALILLFMDLFVQEKKSVRENTRQAAFRGGIFVLYVIVACIGFKLPNIIIGQMGGFRVEGGNSRWAHVAMGLQEGDKAPGWYNFYVDRVFEENQYDKELTKQAALTDIRGRLREFGADPYMAWEFLHRKLASVWNNPTFECFSIQNARYTGAELPSIVKSVINDGGKLNILLIGLLDISQTIVLFGVLMYLICGKTTDIRRLLFMILFIGGFLFSVFWEAKCRYVVPFYFLLIPYAYPGYVMVLQKRRIKTVLCVLAMVAVIGVWDHPWVNAALKLQQDTDAYYDYIHEYDHNFEWFRY